MTLHPRKHKSPLKLISEHFARLCSIGSTVLTIVGVTNAKDSTDTKSTEQSFIRDNITIVETFPITGIIDNDGYEPPFTPTIDHLGEIRANEMLREGTNSDKECVIRQCKESDKKTKESQ